MSHFYEPLVIQSLNPNNLQMLDRRVFGIYTTFTALETLDEDRKKVVLKKLDDCKSIIMTHGLLLSSKLLRDPILTINLEKFNGSANGTIWIEGSTFYPKKNSVLIGAKITDITKDGQIKLNYRGSGNILIFKDDASFNTDPEKGKLTLNMVEYSIGDFISVKAETVNPRMNSRTFNIVGKPFIHMHIPLMKRVVSHQSDETLTYKLSKDLFPYATETDIPQYGEFFAYFDSKNHINFDQLYKKLINPYELIYPNKKNNKNVEELYAKFPYKIDKPVSRAYFKAMELVHFFKMATNPSMVLTLGDAPGGFAQAVVQMFENCQVATVSLLDKSAIQYDARVKEHPRIKIDPLLSEDGDLLNVENISYLQKKYNNVDMVLCDGALGYADKERNHINLLFSEIIIALSCLRKGGSAAFKLYKIWNRLTIDMFRILLANFEYALIYKCRSSRIASTETFFVGMNFKGDNKPLDLVALYSLLLQDQNITAIIESPVPDTLLYKIVKFNTFYDKVVVFHHQEVLEYHNYEGNRIDDVGFTASQKKYAEKFFALD